MYETYTGHGIRFRYPSDWQFKERQSESEASFLVASPETSFWSLTLFFEQPSPDDVLESALDAFCEEYDELDIYTVDATPLFPDCLARDLEFVCLELINSAFLRVIPTKRFTVFVFYQATDHELKQTRSVLEGISKTLQCDFGDDVITD